MFCLSKPVYGALIPIIAGQRQSPHPTLGEKWTKKLVRLLTRVFGTLKMHHKP